MIHNTIKNMPEEKTCACSETLRDAIITGKEGMPKETIEKLKPIIEGFV